jgi:hypothetical protein
MKNLSGSSNDQKNGEISAVSPFTRRNFIKGAAGSSLWLSMANRLGAQSGSAALQTQVGAIRGVRVGSPITVPDNFGDTWVSTWASDDNLYAPSNDTLGFEIPDFLTKEQIKLFQIDFAGFLKQLTADRRKQFMSRFAPIAFSRVEGSDPLHLHGVTVNRMRDFVAQDNLNEEFVSAMVEGRKPKPPADGRSWKSSGCAFIDGALYWVIARHQYPEHDDIKGLRQNAKNASIIKSTDFGKTWTRSAAENLDSPMFPGTHFATPYFIDYGRNRLHVDGADRYVYATSNNGFWDNGDSLVLGRVLRSRIGHLNGSDWEFFLGGDGARDASWTSDASKAKPIIEKPGQLGETGAVYLPARQRYMLIGWYYPGGSGYFKGSSNKTIWDFYESPKPWGPWTLIGSHEFSPQGYYCPGVCPKFQSADKVYVTTAGDFNNWWDHYRLTMVPVDLS